eukprot:TRINITY_DN43289_c0_g1_i1.p1 TRINITY_DN43289_c0_g1~~TRINITY_DN43289_c0_g1_i1.p1  ORF type:complete len:830 (-),score=118.22 TRINITY_DN43289_c0_g1_i1:137-2626(-)
MLLRLLAVLASGYPALLRADLCAEKKGLNCNGEDLDPHGQVASSAAECCARCHSFGGCKAWTWNSGGNHLCYVKSGCTNSVVGQPTISGLGDLPPAPTPAPRTFPWNNESLSVQERVAALSDALTISEQISLLGSSSRAVPRLAVDSFEWSSEGLHGIAWNGRSTVFPAPIGLAATFDTDVLKDLGAVDAREARAKFYHGDGSGLSLFAPNINIFRDPRWGRGQETYGEDPVLAGKLAAALITSAQEPFVDTDVLPVLLTDKHFAVYNLESNYAPPLNGTDGQYRLRFYASASESDLEYTYLVSHAAAVKAGVASVMCAYNAVNGLPMCANGPLLSRLRHRLGFEGIVVTDCGAIGFSVSPMGHFASHVNASAQALQAGTNVNCGSEYENHLQEALDANLISKKLLLERLSPVLGARVRLGDFDTEDPYRAWYDKETYDGIVDSVAHRERALSASLKSMVLLRNSFVEGMQVLPMAPGTKVAVIGPNANSTDALLSNYAGCRFGAGGRIDPACTLITVLEGLREHGDVTFAQGAEMDSSETSGIETAAQTARDADVAVVVLGLSTCQETGPMCQEAEAHDRKHIHLPGVQEQVLKAVVAANPRTVLVLLNGGAVSGDFYTSVPAVLEAFYPGALGGRAVANTLFGLSSPAGRLPYTIVQSIHDLPANYYSMGMADAPGRTYRYFTGEPGFAFGFGLSYTRFGYDAVKATLQPDGSIIVGCRVTNLGSRDSDDVVLVISGGSAAPGAPRLGLVGFHRVYVPAGEMRAVSIAVTLPALAAQGYSAGTHPMKLFVGGRLPGSPGAWTDGAGVLPPAPEEIPVIGSTMPVFEI